MGMLYDTVLVPMLFSPHSFRAFGIDIPSLTQTEFGLLNGSTETCVVFGWPWRCDVLENHDLRCNVMLEERMMDY